MDISNKGILLVLSGPAGSGKGTIVKNILERDSMIRLSVSATTRAPRPGEIDGVHYSFVSSRKFEEMIASDEMLEHTRYCGNYYGTLMSEVDSYLDKGINVILEIEVQGAMKIREKRPEALFVFIAPPSVAELTRRLKKRGTETDEVIAERVSQAAGEIAAAEKYDYIIVNDALEDAVSDFFAVIRAEELKSENMGEILNEVLKNA